MRPSLIIVTQGPHKHFVVEIQPPASIKYQINSSDIKSSFEIYEAWQRHSLMNCILYLPCQWRPATPPTVPSPTCWFSCTLARQAVGLVSVHNYLFTHCPKPPRIIGSTPTSFRSWEPADWRKAQAGSWSPLLENIQQNWVKWDIFIQFYWWVKLMHKVAFIELRYTWVPTNGSWWHHSQSQTET